MLQKAKREKQQKGNKNALKMYTHLVRQKPYSIMLKSFPKINHLNFLRAATNIHINYVIFSFIEAIHKANMVYQSMSQAQNNYLLENIKIGIIGAGIMGRLVLNSLLALQKEGIVPSNIMISTRQQEDMEPYTSIFKIPIEFNNQKIAELADILIIATPSTLDNWVLLDLKAILQKRIASQAKLLNEKPNSKSIKNLQMKPDIKKLNPLIYITTSNMTTQKLSKLFPFPILTPFLRGEQDDYINKIVGQSQAWLMLQQDLHLQQIQKAICNKVIEKIDLLKETLSFVFQKSFVFQEKNSKGTAMDSGKKSNKALKISEGKVLSSEVKTLKDEKANEKLSQIGQSKKSSISYSTTSNGGMYNIEAVRNLVDEVLGTNGSYQQTFLVRSRKWRMAYNNFIA